MMKVTVLRLKVKLKISQHAGILTKHKTDFFKSIFLNPTWMPCLYVWYNNFFNITFIRYKCTYVHIFHEYVICEV